MSERGCPDALPIASSTYQEGSPLNPSCISTVLEPTFTYGHSESLNGKRRLGSSAISYCCLVTIVANLARPTLSMDPLDGPSCCV